MTANGVSYSFWICFPIASSLTLTYVRPKVVSQSEVFPEGSDNLKRRVQGQCSASGNHWFTDVVVFTPPSSINSQHGLSSGRNYSFAN